MSYKVIHDFYDGKDDRQLYKAGDKYPRDRKRGTKERLVELSGKDNKVGYPLIKEEKQVV